ncbi:MAG: hypothetical protein AAF488_00145 [Planctomycetota bacterium]
MIARPRGSRRGSLSLAGALALTTVLLTGAGAFASTPVADLLCFIDCSAPASVALTWQNTDVYDSIEVRRDGSTIATLPGDVLTFTDPSPVLPATYTVVAFCPGVTVPGVDCTAVPPPISDLECVRDCVMQSVTLTWTLGGFYESIEVFDDITGTSLGTLSGSATSFVAPIAAGGSSTFAVVGVCAGLLSDARTCSFGTVGPPIPPHLILAFEGPGGLVDSVQALENGLTGLGHTFVTIHSLDELPCGFVPGAGFTVWSMTGTFPDNRVMTDEHGQFLVDHILAGGGVYHEGGDTWGMDPPTIFTDYDGIGAATDGDDSFQSYSGSDIMSAYAGMYLQDQAGDDSTDQLSTVDDDLGGPDSRVAWTEGALGLGYTTGVYYLTNPGLGKVFSQSFELGGIIDLFEEILNDLIEGLGVPRCIRVDMFTATQPTLGPIILNWTASSGDWTSCTLVVDPPNPHPIETYTIPSGFWPSGGYSYTPLWEGIYVFSLTPICSGYIGGTITTDKTWFRPFERGDANKDGNYDLGDAIETLGYLFGGGVLGCEAAADSNDDGGLNIGDGVYTLNYLFAGGAAPPPPFGDCGNDPTGNPLTCDEYDACP